ncbi:uncharacterized protein VTP21DRAFT_8974 [Calcarisporiella thermophila]|uniref:uncharacterized protein n=1 Tax=Calcarisporiella thermophila TaxID=911321 RepID=UPI003743744D
MAPLPDILNRIKLRQGKSLPCTASLTVVSLDKLPLAKGLFQIRYHSLFFHGRTESVPLAQYRALWNSTVKHRVRIPLDDVLGMLGPSHLVLSVHQLSDGADTVLGQVELDMAQFVGGGVTNRRFCLLHSNFMRASLQISLRLHPLVQYPQAYQIPPLDRTHMIPDEKDLLEMLNHDLEVEKMKRTRMNKARWIPPRQAILERACSE